MSEVLQATKGDLRMVLGWLERKYQEDGEGFWSNKSVVIQSFEDSELWVIREDN